MPSWYDAVNTEFQYQHNLMLSPMAMDYPANIQNNGQRIITAEQTVPTLQQSLTPVEQTNTPVPFQGAISMYFNQNNGFPLSIYQNDPNTLMTNAPCQGPRPWNYAQCYGFYGQPPCPLVNLIDMEDFMWVCVHCSIHSGTCSDCVENMPLIKMRFSIGRLLSEPKNSWVGWIFV